MTTDWRSFARDLIADIETLRGQMTAAPYAVEIDEAAHTISWCPYDQRPPDDAVDLVDTFDVDQALDEFVTGWRRRLWVAEINEDRPAA